MTDPIEEFLDALRPWLRVHQAAFDLAMVTGVQIEAKYEQKQRRSGWHVEVGAKVNSKVIEAWAVDEGRIRAIK